MNDKGGIFIATEMEKSYSAFREALYKLKNHKMAVLGLGVWITEILLMLLLPVIFNLQPNVSDPLAFRAAPSAQHILGTDSIGRDLLARLIYGGRTSLFVGIVSSLIGLLIGVPVGLYAGYYRGWVEALIMRTADVAMSIPSMILILVLVSVVGPSIWSVTIVIGVLGWTQFARIIHANVLSVSQKEYVEAARAIGASNFTIIYRYILPNSFAPVLIAVTFQAANAIIMESALSFLGMGVQPPQASWGNMLYDAQSITVLSSKPWVWLPPGIAIIITVLSINFFGDGIRDVLDPRVKI
jgi:peptide/nickel transport system permease protein